jgi:hypothetical protein
MAVLPMVDFPIELAEVGELAGDLRRAHRIVGFGAQQADQFAPLRGIGAGLVEIEAIALVHLHPLTCIDAAISLFIVDDDVRHGER